MWTSTVLACSLLVQACSAFSAGAATVGRPAVARVAVARVSVGMAEIAYAAELGMTEEEVREGEDWTSTLAELAGASEGDKVVMAPMAPYTNAQAMQAALAQWKTHPTDVGSTQVQVARLSERIKYLTAHQAKNKKDKSTERGLVLLANRRRKLLKYLINEDIAVFEKISAAYGIRTRKIVEESMGVVRRSKSRSAGAIE